MDVCLKEKHLRITAMDVIKRKPQEPFTKPGWIFGLKFNQPVEPLFFSHKGLCGYQTKEADFQSRKSNIQLTWP